MGNISVGSICSGIEAASVAWSGLGYEFRWFSEIAPYPSKLLNHKYPRIPNLGDMCEIPKKLRLRHIDSPDLICGGTPCQAFSLAGWKKGLEDDRGNLTLKFVDIIQENDAARRLAGKCPTTVFWENVEGVLNDKTNAFGCFVSSLAGLQTEIQRKKWPSSGLIHGPKRNVAWRVLDAKFFGLPQQRKRLYVLAGGKDFYPEHILFESSTGGVPPILESADLNFTKEGHSIEVFRSYTDCLYSAYGTKWNGNAAAYNGSLFVSQNGRLRRFTPLECERLMGFPDGYSDLPGSKPTNRYQAVGNSWAVPVVRWLGQRLHTLRADLPLFNASQFSLIARHIQVRPDCIALDLSNGPVPINDGRELNSDTRPNQPQFGRLFDIIDVTAPENFFITPVGCKGILRRRDERRLTINARLEATLARISAQWTDEEIDEISRKQPRGKFSSSVAHPTLKQIPTLPIF
jgi:DNA (cytosine-5)-methyltransferase 1